MTKGVARAGWDIDLRDGEAREDALVHVLLQDKVEHKADQKCRVTGNLFIELKQKGRPSGLWTSTAHRWAFEFDDECWLILPTHRLRALVKEALRKQNGKLVHGGDNDQYAGVLVPIEWAVRRGRIFQKTEQEDSQL